MFVPLAGWCLWVVGQAAVLALLVVLLAHPLHSITPTLETNHGSFCHLLAHLPGEHRHAESWAVFARATTNISAVTINLPVLILRWHSLQLYIMRRS